MNPAVAASPQASLPPRLLLANTQARKAVLRSMEQERNSSMIAYITEARPAFGTVMADDVIPIFYQHLQKTGKVQRLDVFLYTHGGHTLTPNSLVHLLREYCSHLSLLVPYRAVSAGTTTALGANEIVMGAMGRLGPVDPTVTNDFNPEVEITEKDKKGKAKVGISVEDVTAYLALAKDRAGIDTPEAMASVLKILADRVHPLALGNVHRQYLLIRSMSRRLLSLHMNPDVDKERIDQIVDMLTEKLYYHGYGISRHEAQKVIGLPVTVPSEALEKLMWDAYECYKRDLRLGDYDVPIGNFVFDAAVVESAHFTHSFAYEGISSKAKDEVEIKMSKQGWQLLT